MSILVIDQNLITVEHYISLSTRILPSLNLRNADPFFGSKGKQGI